MDGEDLLRMKPHEIKRLHLIRQALEKRISQKQAAEVAGLSPRQMRRLMKRVENEGRRGKPSNRRIADQTKQKVRPADRRLWVWLSPNVQKHGCGRLAPDCHFFSASDGPA